MRDVALPTIARFKAQRIGGVERGYCIPMKKGFREGPGTRSEPPPSPTKAYTRFTPENVYGIPSALVGSTYPAAREGETSSTEAQAVAFVSDEELAGTAVWHANLLRFFEDGGRETYGEYQSAGKALEQFQGNHCLAMFGGRGVFSSPCFRSVAGDADWDQMVIAEYPERDGYLSMGASDEYKAMAHFRHDALERTYIFSCVAPPE